MDATVLVDPFALGILRASGLQALGRLPVPSAGCRRQFVGSASWWPGLGTVLGGTGGSAGKERNKEGGKKRRLRLLNFPRAPIWNSPNASFLLASILCLQAAALPLETMLSLLQSFILLLQGVLG